MVGWLGSCPRPGGCLVCMREFDLSLPFVSLILDCLLSKGVPVLPDTHPIPNDCAPNVQRFACTCGSGVASAGDDFLHLDNGCCKADSFALVWLRARCGFAVGPWPGLGRF